MYSCVPGTEGLISCPNVFVSQHHAQVASSALCEEAAFSEINGKPTSLIYIYY